MKQRVVFIYQNAYSQTGGIQTFNRYFINALEEISLKNIEIEASLVSIYDRNKDIKTTLPIHVLNNSKLQALRYVIRYRKSFDTYIFAHVNLAPLAALLHVINPSARIIFCTHGIEIWKKLSWMKEWIMNRSTVLTVSTFSKSELLKYNSKLSDIRIFPNCIKVKENLEELPNPYEQDTVNLLSVTRLSDSERLKGIDTMIKVMPELIKSIPNIRYSVIGKGEDTKRLKALAKELHIDNYIDFLGFVDDINSYYQHCDIFTLPSKKEGFGIVYLEAMQYKKTVIACNYGGPTDVIIDDITGFLCEYDDITCIVDKIIILFNNQEKRFSMGQAGYERLYEKFTYPSFKLSLQDILIGAN